MPTKLTPAGFAPLLKTLWPTERAEKIFMDDGRELLKWLVKKDVFEGDAMVIPVLTGRPQGRSHVFSNAKENAEHSRQYKFVLTESDRIPDYGVVEIDAEAIYASRSKKGALLEAKDTQIKGILDQLGFNLHRELYRSGSGSIGQIDTVTDGTGEAVIVLTNPSDAWAFAEGQILNSNNTDDATSLRTGAPKVTKVDHDAGEVTVNAEVVATNSWAAGDYLFTDGDAGQAVTGLAGWLPLDLTNIATPFYTVNRANNVAALAGHRVNKPAQGIFKSAQELAMKIRRGGGRPDVLFMNPEAGLQLAEEAGSKVERLDGRKATMGFSGFSILSLQPGPIDVVFDHGCPVDRAYMLERNTWWFAHLEGLPHIVADDGKQANRGDDFDGIEVRVRYWGNLVCNAPGRNGVMAVAA